MIERFKFNKSKSPEENKPQELKSEVVSPSSGTKLMETLDAAKKESNNNPFGKGSNKIVFINPENKNQVIKQNSYFNNPGNPNYFEDKKMRIDPKRNFYLNKLFNLIRPKNFAEPVTVLPSYGIEVQTKVDRGYNPINLIQKTSKRNELIDFIESFDLRLDKNDKNYIVNKDGGVTYIDDIEIGSYTDFSKLQKYIETELINEQREEALSLLKKIETLNNQYYSKE